jgi:hypothetical protein
MKKKDSHLKRSINSINKAHTVIGVSNNVVERIKKITGRQKGIFKVFNGFDTINIKETKLIRETDTISILFGATLVERKGCEYLIRAYSKLVKEFNKTKLIIAGGGELLENLQKISEDLGLGSQVEFLGAVSHDKMLHEMAECDIFCLPSWDEAFGVVYLEAMSFKKPIIGTYDEGISEIVKDGENGFLVKPKNSKDIYDKIKILLSDPQKRSEVGEKGYETIKNITWEKNAREMYNLYDEILNK